MLEKQYSVKFFSSFIEAIQKVCRDFLDYEQGVELSGYLAVEIDNIKKERYVLSEFIQSSGNVISESFCTKAFKTVPKSAQTPEHRVLKEHNTSSSIDLIDSYGQEQASINRRTYLPGGYSSNQRHSTGGFHSVRSTHSSRSQPQIQPRSSTSWISSPETVQSHQTNTSGRSSFPGTQTNIGFEASDRGFKRNATDLEGTPSIKIARSGSADHSIAGSSANLVSETHSNPEFTQSTQSGMEESVHLPLSAKVKQEEEDDDDDVTLIESISDFSKGDGAVGFGGDYSDILRDDVAGSSQNMYMQLSTSGEKVELFKGSSILGSDPELAGKFPSVLVDKDGLLEAERRAVFSRDPPSALLNLVIDLVFTPVELANSTGLGIKPRRSGADPNKQPLDPIKVDAIKVFVSTATSVNGWSPMDPKQTVKKFQDKVTNARKKPFIVGFVNPDSPSSFSS
ncbi:uncharacterized protein LOC121383032 isoform X3 [Gigantopelta aegis]|uniref:uncharacterized protein LOC121383032 isoform X3 n=1 Tax=Gigantopelta aegis TaxID=1735272 RepID=UPI001B888D4B|nr:uncharacterized protein LOC121383032 isoform X3 [Gigantopelta aegis]